MLPKRQKMVQTTSASADVNKSSNHSIVSMFARHCSHNHLQNSQLDKQHVVGQTANLSEFTDRPRLDNKLSLSVRRKRVCTTDAVIDLTDDTANNNTAHISQPLCMVFSLADNLAKATTDDQNSPSEASLLSSDSYQNVSLDSSFFISQQRSANFTITDGGTKQLSQEMPSCQNDALLFVENSISDDPSLERQAAIDTEVAFRVPYYLENFLLVLNSVFSDTFYAELFNDDDLSVWDTFQNLSGNCFSQCFLETKQCQCHGAH